MTNRIKQAIQNIVQCLVVEEDSRCTSFLWISNRTAWLNFIFNDVPADEGIKSSIHFISQVLVMIVFKQVLLFSCWKVCFSIEGHSKVHIQTNRDSGNVFI